MPLVRGPLPPGRTSHAARERRYDAVTAGESDDPGSRYGWGEECGNNEKRRERPGVHGVPPRGRALSRSVDAFTGS